MTELRHSTSHSTRLKAGTMTSTDISRPLCEGIRPPQRSRLAGCGNACDRRHHAAGQYSAGDRSWLDPAETLPLISYRSQCAPHDGRKTAADGAREVQVAEHHAACRVEQRNIMPCAAGRLLMMDRAQ